MPKPFNFDLEVSSAHLGASGWALETFSHSNPFDCHCFYVRDFKTGHVRIFTVRMEDFESIVPPMSSNEVSVVIAQAIKKYAKGKITKRDKKVIGPALAIYIKGTAAFKIWSAKHDAGARIHAIINIYGGNTLRPALMNCEETTLSADELMKYTDQIHSMDRQSHPDWFH